MDKKFLMLLLAVILLFSACAPMAEIPEESTTQTTESRTLKATEGTTTVKITETSTPQTTEDTAEEEPDKTPEAFIIEFEPADVVEMKTAAIITADMLSIDEKKSAEIFLTASGDADLSLEGPGYMYRWKNSNFQEYVSVGMTGEYGSSGRKSDGTFSFLREDIQSYLIPLDDIVFKVSNNDQIWRRYEIVGLEGEKELDGISLEETRKRFEENLSALGLPMDSFRATKTYCVTAEEQRKLYPIYSDRSNPLTVREEELFSNGCALSYRQFFDGIPVIDCLWHGYAGCFSYIQSVQGVFNANGLMQVLVSGIFLPSSKEEAKPVLTLSEAIEKLKAELANIDELRAGYVEIASPRGQVRVIHAELNYLAGADDSGVITLYPAWVFSTVKKSLSGHPSETIYAFDAFTGQRISHSGEFTGQHIAEEDENSD